MRDDQATILQQWPRRTYWLLPAGDYVPTTPHAEVPRKLMMELTASTSEIGE